MTLTQVLERLNQVSWLQTQNLSGTGRSSQLLNLTGKILTMPQQKQITVAGRTRKVSSMELADQDGSVVEIHVWDDACEQVKNLRIGDGITIVGCSAQREADGQHVKLNLWDSAHVLQGVPIAQALSRWDPQHMNLTRITAGFAPSGPFAPGCQREFADLCCCLGQRA